MQNILKINLIFVTSFLIFYMKIIFYFNRRENKIFSK